MFEVDRLILLAGLLGLVGILSSKLSSRVGLPVLVLFVLLGMLAGSEGPGGVPFENYPLAHAVGTLALVVILFDGGLRTTSHAFRTTLWPALTLATGGVLVTALLTGWAATRLLGLPPLQGLLLGSIVSSTDAAAVFSVLRSRGLHLRPRLASVLEVESGANDPMAIFLTIACLELLAGEAGGAAGLGWLFVRQMAVGVIAGLVAGRLTAWGVNRIRLDAAGLYPVLTATAALLAFGLAAVGGGSGFLAVYLAGIVVGNSRIVFQRGIFLFHDGVAWFAQIVMFVVLGLLSFPSRLLDVVAPALLTAAVLMFVARPLAVFLALPAFGFSIRETAFVSWGGLKGAVPIILATYPLLLGQEETGRLLFDIVFFVVLVSAILQGSTLSPAARLLGLQLPARPEPPVSLEITSLRDVDGDIVDYRVESGSGAAGRRIEDLAIPDGAVVALVARGQRLIPPRGGTRLEPGDHVFIVMEPGRRPALDRIFAEAAEAPAARPALVEFTLRADTTVADLETFYGLALPAPRETTLGELVEDRLGADPAPGEGVRVGDVVLNVVTGPGDATGQVRVAITPSDVGS